MRSVFYGLVGTSLACFLLACHPLGEVTGPDGSIDPQREFGVTNNVGSDVTLDIILISTALVKDLTFGETAPIRFNANLDGEYSRTVTFIAKGWRHSNGKSEYLGCDDYRVTVRENSNNAIRPWGIEKLSLSKCGT